MYDKSNQQRSIYDSYNVELASTKIKSITLENASNTYSTFNSVKFDIDDTVCGVGLQRLYIAPSPNYKNNTVSHKLPTLSEYFTSGDEKIFIDLRRGKGYTNEIEKLNRDDSDLKITIKLKPAAAKR